MQIGPTRIVSGRAEAFRAWCARVVVTAADDAWLDAAAAAFVGYGTSVIGCDAEVAREFATGPAESPDGRPSCAMLAFGFRRDRVARATANRAGQCLLTCPTARFWDGFPESEDRYPLGDYLRYFGDGYERSVDGGWVVPTMEGEVELPATGGLRRGVAGATLIVQGESAGAALEAALRGADAARRLPGVATPFPRGVCRSGSRVGSKYPRLVASTFAAYCPSLRGRAPTLLDPRAGAGYEVVLNGIDEAPPRSALRAAMHAAAGDGVVALALGEYGGGLGGVRIEVGELLAEP